MALESTPGTVLVPAAQFAEMRANQAKVEEMLAAREIEATAANIRATAASGQVEALARSHRAEIEQERQRAAAIAAKSELTAALAKQPVLPAAVDQLTSILGSEISASPDGRGGYNVMSKDYRPVAEFVQSKLADPSFSHFRSDVRPQPPVNRPTPPPTELIAEPANLGQAFIANFQKQRQAVESKNSATDPRLDPSQSFGLGQSRGGPAWGGALPGLGRPR